MIYKNSKEWGEEIKEFCEILDPDGWDRSNLKESLNEVISKDEFCKRLADSTIKADLNKLYEWAVKP